MSKMKTAMTLLIEYLNANKDLSMDAVIAMAKDLRQTIEKDTLIRSYIGYYDESVSDEQLIDAYKEALGFYQLYWGDHYAYETQITKETQTDGE